MQPLIDAIRGMFSSATMTGGDVGDAATFVMENVAWSKPLQAREARTQPVIGDSLEALAKGSGQYGSNAHIITTAMLAVNDEIRWNSAFAEWQDPDIQAFSRRFAWCSLVGREAPLESSAVEIGLSVQGRDVLYPAHAHQAVETYWVLAGDADWKVGIDPWFSVCPGSTIHHETGVRHAMQTNHRPMLALWLWTTHLDSRLVFVRG